MKVTITKTRYPDIYNYIIFMQFIKALNAAGSFTFLLVGNLQHKICTIILGKI